MKTIPDRVREHCAAVAADARHVSIDLEACGRIEPGPPPVLDPERHFLEGSREEVAAYLLTLDSINFGSGWFPTLRKREGMSGYYTVASSLADHFRARGPLDLHAVDAAQLGGILGQEVGHPLIALYVEALLALGDWLGSRTFTAAIEEADGSAVRLASALAEGMPFFFDDVGFWKRAQIAPNDLALAGVASFSDLDSLTIFADNLVPHVLRVDGVLRYSDSLASRIDRGELLEQGSEEEVEIRACAVVACMEIAAALGVPERTLDTWLWDRGQAPRYKSRPRHRSRTVFY